MTQQPVILPMTTRSEDLDEKAVMRQARHDPARFAPLYEMYFPRIYAYCARRTDTAQEAEDLTSTVFTKVLRNLDSYQGGNVGAWLFRIAHNEVINHYRGRRANISLDAHELDFPTDAESPSDVLANAQEAAYIRELVGQLSPEQQNLLNLKLSGELTSAQIGEVLGKSASAVRVELHRIIKLLRVLYFEERSDL